MVSSEHCMSFFQPGGLTKKTFFFPDGHLRWSVSSFAPASLLNVALGQFHRSAHNVRLAVYQHRTLNQVDDTVPGAKTDRIGN